MALREAVRFESDLDREFAQWTVATIGGERIRHCIQCGVCSAVCPLSSYMDYTPRQVIHLARDGFKQEVLQSFTIWLCAACYACTAACPKQIKVTEVMHAFKQRAMQEGVYPKRFPVPIIEREFYGMVRARGRITEIWLVILLLLRTNILKGLGMIMLGWHLLRTGRLTLKLESIKRRRELQALLTAVDTIPPVQVGRLPAATTASATTASATTAATARAPTVAAGASRPAAPTMEVVA
jgi:heterodisulfide reductase subunit C